LVELKPKGWVNWRTCWTFSLQRVFVSRASTKS